MPPSDIGNRRVRPRAPAAPAACDADPPAVRVAPLLALVARLRALDLDPARALNEAGFGTGLPADPEHLVPYRRATALFAACVRLSGQPDFGLQAGASLGLASLGPPGDIARHSPTVGDALRALVAHFRLHDRGGSVVLDVRDGIARLAYAVHEPGAQAVDQVADFSIAVGCRLMRDLCGESWRPSVVRLAHGEPPNSAAYGELFRCRIEFDAPEDSLLFAATWLERSIARADPGRLEALAREALANERQDARSWVQRMRPLLRAGLACGECSIAQVSTAAGIHRRTLERRLREEGTTFRELLDDVRHQVAIHLLEKTRLPMTEIADALGFADPAVFSRAFRRWQGVSPSAWRAVHLARPTDSGQSGIRDGR
jgi:AraC-like DNA-binding protein